MKTQEWKDCYVHRNIGIRGSNAKYETGMKELMPLTFLCSFCVSVVVVGGGVVIYWFSSTVCSYSVCCMVVNAAWISGSFFCIIVDVAWFSINVPSTALWSAKLLYSFCIDFVNVLSLQCILDYQLSILCCVKILQNNKKLWRQGPL